MSERIDALEFKVAHLEQALQELSDVVYRQQRELDSLRDRNQLLLAGGFAPKRTVLRPCKLMAITTGSSAFKIMVPSPRKMRALAAA